MVFILNCQTGGVHRTGLSSLVRVSRKFISPRSYSIRIRFRHVISLTRNARRCEAIRKDGLIISQATCQGGHGICRIGKAIDGCSSIANLLGSRNVSLSRGHFLVLRKRIRTVTLVGPGKTGRRRRNLLRCLRSVVNAGRCVPTVRRTTGRLSGTGRLCTRGLLQIQTTTQRYSTLHIRGRRTRSCLQRRGSQARQGGRVLRTGL